MTKTTLADIIGTCERAAFRMGLDACEPPPLEFTTEQDAALLAMHAGGMGPAAIAAVVAVPQEAIQQRLLWLTFHVGAADSRRAKVRDDRGALPKPHARSA